MIFPCDNCCSSDKIWILWRLHREKDSVSVSVMECAHHRAEDKGLSLTAEEVFRPSTSYAKIYQPRILGGNHTLEFFNAVHAAHEAIRRSSLPPTLSPFSLDPIHIGDVLVQNPIDPATRLFKPVTFSKAELSREPAVEKAFDNLFSAAEKAIRNEAVLRRIWSRFPPGTQKKFELA